MKASPWPPSTRPARPSGTSTAPTGCRTRSTAAVRQVRRGLRRTIGRAPRRPTRPLSVADLRQIVTAIDRTTLRGARDTAIILLGFAGALRRSELAALTLADLEVKPGGLLLHLRRSKTDPGARGQVVGIAHGHHALTDPVAALDTWLAVRGGRSGPVFTSLRGRRPSLQPMSGNAVSSVVKERALAAGLSGGRISGHSLRAGHATSAALAGIGIDRIAAQTRHQDISVLVNRYAAPGGTGDHVQQGTSGCDATTAAARNQACRSRCRYPEDEGGASR